MKICSVIDTLQHGGAETLLLEITRRAEFDHLVCYRRGEGERRREFERAGATVFDLGFGWQYDPGGVANLRSLIQDCDIVHGHLPASISIARAVGSTTSASVVSTHHNMPTTYGFISGMLERITQPLDDTTVAVSDGVATAHGGKNWKTIYNGIDVRSFSDSVLEADTTGIQVPIEADETLTLLNIARYTKQKSQRDLILMTSELSKSVDEVHLILVGHGPREEQLRRCASKHGVESQVTVTGRVPNVEPYYSIADVFVSASAQEGLPITFLEAMAAGLPIVATDIPGVREVIVDGTTGKLVPHSDPVALAQAVRSITESNQMFGYAGYSHVKQKFHIDTTVSRYEKLYRELL